MKWSVQIVGVATLLPWACSAFAVPKNSITRNRAISTVSSSFPSRLTHDLPDRVSSLLFGSVDTGRTIHHDRPSAPVSATRPWKRTWQRLRSCQGRDARRSVAPLHYSTAPAAPAILDEQQFLSDLMASSVQFQSFDANTDVVTTSRKTPFRSPLLSQQRVVVVHPSNMSSFPMSLTHQYRRYANATDTTTPNLSSTPLSVEKLSDSSAQPSPLLEAAEAEIVSKAPQVMDPHHHNELQLQVAQLQNSLQVSEQRRATEYTWYRTTFQEREDLFQEKLRHVMDQLQQVKYAAMPVATGVAVPTETLQLMEAIAKSHDSFQKRMELEKELSVLRNLLADEKMKHENEMQEMQHQSEQLVLERDETVRLVRNRAQERLQQRQQEHNTSLYQERTMFLQQIRQRDEDLLRNLNLLQQLQKYARDNDVVLTKYTRERNSVRRLLVRIHQVLLLRFHRRFIRPLVVIPVRAICRASLRTYELLFER
jgi:hypothetical protein